MAEARAWLAKVLPPGMNSSAWYSRLAPPDSIIDTAGSFCSMQISWMRRVFCTPHGVMVPPLMAKLLAVTMQRVPET